MSERRKLQRAALKRLFGHSYMEVVRRRSSELRYAWVVRGAKDHRALLGPRGSFEEEEAAWTAGWEEIMRRAST
jgi:hypothetical protein